MSGSLMPKKITLEFSFNKFASSKISPYHSNQNQNLVFSKTQIENKKETTQPPKWKMKSSALDVWHTSILTICKLLVSACLSKSVYNILSNRNSSVTFQCWNWSLPLVSYVDKCDMICPKMFAILYSGY